MSVPRANVAPGRPEWLHNFQAWIARLSPAALAELIDVLARELRERGHWDSEALGKATEIVRAHQVVFGATRR